MYNLRLHILEIIGIFFLLLFLAIAIYMVCRFYVCDHGNCQIIKEASQYECSKKYVKEITCNIMSDGMWPIPYIGATIIALAVCWYTQCFRVIDFGVIWVISFVVIYFLFMFFGHHYIKPVMSYVNEKLDNMIDKEEEVINIRVEDDVYLEE